MPLPPILIRVKGYNQESKDALDYTDIAMDEIENF